MSLTTTAADRDAPLTARGRRTRAALAAAAREVFERDGFTDARVTDIAEHAGVAHGTFYSYFDSKEDVFRTVILEFMEDLLRPAERRADGPAASPYESIREANRSYVLVFQQNAKLMLLWAHVAGNNPVLSDLLQQQKSTFVGRAASGLRRWQERGLADPGLDAAMAAQALGGMVSEFCSQWFRNDMDFELDRAVETLSTIWARAIGVEVPEDRSRPRAGTGQGRQ
jgi:AcrR family transcriptional regulator